MNLYNDIDPKACAWTQELIGAGMIAPGKVLCKSITEVEPHEISEFTQCHWFNGISGWSHALDIAGWPRTRSVWCASLPCQSFSCAGQGRGFDDERGQLWFPFLRLARECRPPIIFGEQVPAAIGHGWLDRIFTDLEAEGYACGAIVLGAHSVGAPHIRQRLYWVANSKGKRNNLPEEDKWKSEPIRGSDSCWVANAKQSRRQATGSGHEIDPGRQSKPGQSSCWLAHPSSGGQRTDRSAPGSAGHVAAASSINFWSDAIWHECRDGKARRIPRFESGVFGMVDGISEGVDLGWLESSFPLCKTVPGRVGLLKGYGNAINPYVAKVFIEAVMECL